MLGPLGPGELVMIGGLLVLLFGAKRLPELGKSFGQGLREFRRSVSGALEETDDEAGGKSPAVDGGNAGSK